MINRIKEWDIKNLKINDRQVISLALILSVMALIMAIPGSSNCASANTCTVASTGTFTGNLGIKSNTAFQLTQQHSLAVDQIANWEAVGGNHTGSVIMKDNSGDMNLNGGLVLGTSATSTNGTIRFNGSEVQVYNSGWSGVGGADQNVFTTINGNSGSLTASTTTTSIKIEAAADSGLTVVAAGDKLEIQSAGGGGATAMEFYAYIGTSYTNTAGVYYYDTEYYDTSSCFTVNGSPNYTITYTCVDTRVFQVIARVEVESSGNAQAIINGYVNTQNLGETIDNPRANTIDQTSGVFTAVFCLNQNDTIKFTGNTNNGLIYGAASPSVAYSNLQLTEKLAFGTSQSCTNGIIN